MKIPMILALTFGLLAVPHTHAGEAKLGHPHWVIIMTIIDRTTGERVRQYKLGGAELEFNDLSGCKKIVDQVIAPETERTTSVLTCQKVPEKVDHPVSRMVSQLRPPSRWSKQNPSELAPNMQCLLLARFAIDSAKGARAETSFSPTLNLL